MHHCTQPSISNFRFYDISGANASDPQLLHQLNVNTHEFFLWEDPNNPERALMFAGSAGSTCGMSGGAPTCPFSVWDISPVREGQAPVTLFSGLHGFTRFPAFPAPVQVPTGALHSLSVSNDGTRAYFALLTGGFAVVDVSDFAAGAPDAAAPPDHAQRGPAALARTGSPQRGQALEQGLGVRLRRGVRNGHGPGPRLSVGLGADDRHLRPATADGRGGVPAAGELRVHVRRLEPASDLVLRPQPDADAEDRLDAPGTPAGSRPINIQKPWAPYQLAEFFPEPLDEVMLEDPRLSSDPDTGRNEKVVMWSYPIIKDGLIYVVDLRNGLYVLDYEGRFENEVEHIGFLEGNSNQGDALCFEPVGSAPDHCD